MNDDGEDAEFKWNNEILNIFNLTFTLIIICYTQIIK